jgi:hypothetical protein
LSLITRTVWWQQREFNCWWRINFSIPEPEPDINTAQRKGSSALAFLATQSPLVMAHPVHYLP